MIANDLLLRTARGESVKRPPVWLMRQAGRILPQYRKLRSNFPNFVAFIKTPEAVAEATLQPVDELGVDAAILFSDILVIPESMGLHYDLVEKKGPVFRQTVQTQKDVEALISGAPAADTIDYVYEGLKQTKSALADRVPLIGFAGAPWTLMAYMIEGSGSKTFSKAKRFLYTQPQAAHLLLDKIADTTICYLQNKVKAGANLIQLFDSWAGILTPYQYRTFAIPYISKICKAIDMVPLTVFSKGAWFALDDLNQLDCQVIGLDWNMEPLKVRQALGSERCLQGNLDPCNLYADPKEIEQTTMNMIKAFGEKHIVNLGHGVYPDTPLDGVRAFVNTVKAYKYSEG